MKQLLPLGLDICFTTSLRVTHFVFVQGSFNNRKGANPGQYRVVIININPEPRLSDVGFLSLSSSAYKMRTKQHPPVELL
jgi:hypothetical protein